MKETEKREGNEYVWTAPATTSLALCLLSMMRVIPTHAATMSGRIATKISRESVAPEGLMKWYRYKERNMKAPKDQEVWPACMHTHV